VPTSDSGTATLGIMWRRDCAKKRKMTSTTSPTVNINSNQRRKPMLHRGCQIGKRGHHNARSMLALQLRIKLLMLLTR